SLAVQDGVPYWIGLCTDQTGSSIFPAPSSGSAIYQSSGNSYAAFPQPLASTTTFVTGAAPFQISWTISPTDNNSLVNEPQQDGAATYVYDSNVNDMDLYGIASIPVTPAGVVAVTTRVFVQKSDAGSRSGAVVLKSGLTNYVGLSTNLSTTWS